MEVTGAIGAPFEPKDAAMPEPINVEVSTVIDADPEALYDLVSDVTRMGEWSPETRSAEWLDSATSAPLEDAEAFQNRFLSAMRKNKKEARALGRLFGDEWAESFLEQHFFVGV